MARVIHIKNFKLIKRKLSVQEMLSGLSYHFGTQDEYGRMAQLDVIGNGPVIVYDDHHIGRGVQIVEANNKFVELALPIPSTSYDVEVFYNLANNIARQWSSKSIVDVDYEQDVLLTDIDSLKIEDCGNCSINDDYGKSFINLDAKGTFQGALLALICMLSFEADPDRDRIGIK